MTHRNKKDRYNEIFTAYLFLFPFIIMWLIWFLYPTIKAFLISFYNYNYINPQKNEFVGLGNYIRLFGDPYFYKALKNSFVMVFIVVPIQTIVALLIAVVLNGKIKFKNFFRTVCYIPYVISSIAVAIFFMYFFIKNGVGAKFFGALGFKNVTWFTSVHYALPFIAIMYIWQQIGFYMVVYLGGLQNIPPKIYESCEIDGANPFKRFIYITLPMLKPITFMVLTHGMINAFQIFDQIAAVCKSKPLGSPAGATSTMVTFLYQQSFKYMEMGYGSASAVILFLIIFMIALIQKKLIGRDEI